MTITDRFGNVPESLAIKAPCRVATTANITLSGLQTIDGVAVASGDRILVKNQTDAKQNGIYQASTGNWLRPNDCNDNESFIQGTGIYVAQGTTNGNTAMVISTADDPIVIGTSLITFISSVAGVPVNRTISTTAPLTGGGTLAGNLALALALGSGLTVAASQLAIAAGGVSLAMMASRSANTLLGNPSGGAAAPSEITLGATLAFSGSALQTVALSGDVTTSANSFVTTIAPNAVSNAKFRQGAGLSVVGVAGTSLANVADITGTTDQVLRVSAAGTVLGFGAINLASGNAVSGLLTATNGGTNNAFFQVSGPATSIKTFTLPNATCSILTTNAAVTLAQGGTGQVSAAAARGASGLNIEAFRGIGNTNDTLLATDRVVGTNATFTATRTWTLPAGNTVNAGQPLLVCDFQGTVTGANALIIARAGSDTINGATSFTINTSNGGAILISDGGSPAKWTAQAIGSTSTAGVSAIGGVTGAVGVGGDLSVSGSTLVAGIGLKNKLDNSSFDVWQRGTSFAAGSAVYGPDRWKVTRYGTAGATFSRQAAAGGAGTLYKLRMQRDNGNASTQILGCYQAIETIEAVSAAGQTVTLSFYAQKGANYSATSNNFVSQITTGTGTDQAADLGDTGGWTGSAPVQVTHAITGTRTRYSQVLAVPSNATQVLVRFEITPVGTAGAADFVDIDSVQLEISPVATAYDKIPTAFVLARCQRHYYRLNSLGTNNQLGISQAYSTTAAFGIRLNLPVPLRIAATPTHSAASHFSAWIASAISAAAFSSITWESSHDAMVPNDMTGSSGLVAGNATIIKFNSASGYVEVSADL